MVQAWRLAPTLTERRCRRCEITFHVWKFTVTIVIRRDQAVRLATKKLLPLRQVAVIVAGLWISTLTVNPEQPLSVALHLLLYGITFFCQVLMRSFRHPLRYALLSTPFMAYSPLGTLAGGFLPYQALRRTRSASLRPLHSPPAAQPVLCPDSW